MLEWAPQVAVVKSFNKIIQSINLFIAGLVSKQTREGEKARAHEEGTWKTRTQRPSSDMFRRADPPRGDSCQRKVSLKNPKLCDNLSDF